MKFALVILACLVSTTAAYTTESYADCGQTYYYGPSGVISSPNYPYEYYNNLSCYYYVFASTGSSLSFIFKNPFDVEDGYDFVTISCPSNSSFPEQQFTGYSVPEPVSIPWCSQGLVNLETDYIASRSGFSLDYYVSEGGCGKTVHNESFGYVTSPNYPSYYGYNQNCSNIIWAPQQSTFYLYFQAFQLESNCNRDWLEISCLDGSEYGPYRYCGSPGSINLYIYGCSQVLLWFHSDDFNNYPGFNIQYNVYPESACGNTSYYGPSGVISSPNYPGNYYDDLDCNYYINASTGSSISIIFKSFKTELNWDFVTISCPSNSSFPEQQFSGSSLPEPVSLPWCSTGLVNFTTDGSITTRGFTLDYYVSNGGCGNTLYNDSYGYVTSPNYPSNYGYNQNCSNIIWASQRSTFYLYFQQFQLEFDCSRDWLEISCLDGSEYGPYRYCGSPGSINLYIYGCSQVLLWFHSDDFNNYPGFNIQYNVYPEAGTGYTDTSHPPTGTSANQVCGQSSYFDPYGVIRSPNYPGFYYNYLYCDYYVYASTGSSLAFVFKSFHVESADFVTISCTSNSNFPPQEYSGHSLPEPVSIAVCNQGLVNFRTDYTNVSSGFSIDYYINDPGCGSTVYLGSNGQVNSPFWPDGYGYNQNCSNIIWATEQSTIVLNFLSFNLQENCSCDWLEISCLDGSAFGPNRYCGNYDSVELHIYQCSQVLLWFHSDGSSNYPGFNIEYTVHPVGVCGDTSYDESSGVISSPNHPGNYLNYLDCDYTIYASMGSSLSFIFTSFNVEANYDFVTISCPANSSYPEYEFSGDYLPGPLSIPECSQGLVNFHSDLSAVYSGFSLKYYVSDGGCGNTLYYPSSGYVTSPNWPSNYGYNQNCSNIIYAYGRSTFYLNVHAFILQSCCSCDWLEISCLDNSDYGPTRYCGSMAPVSTYIYDCSQVLLWFHSDGSSNDQGFNIEYNVYPYTNDSEVFSNGTLNAEENVPRNGKPKAAENVPKNGKPKAAENEQSKGKPNEAENVPINGKRNAGENVPRNGKPKAAENVPSNGKPNAAENVSINGKRNAGENVPINGKRNAAENVPINGKRNAGENVPINGKRNAAENVLINGKPNAAENVPSNGKRNAGENVPSNGKPNA